MHYKVFQLSSIDRKDENHEADFLLSQLVNDSINDTSIVIPATTPAYQKETVGKTLC